MLSYLIDIDYCFCVFAVRGLYFCCLLVYTFFLLFLRCAFLDGPLCLADEECLVPFCFFVVEEDWGVPLWEGVVGTVVVFVCDAVLFVYMMGSELVSSIFLMVMSFIGGGGLSVLEALYALGDLCLEDSFWSSLFGWVPAMGSWRRVMRNRCFQTLGFALKLIWWPVPTVLHTVAISSFVLACGGCFIAHEALYKTPFSNSKNPHIITHHSSFITHHHSPIITHHHITSQIINQHTFTWFS